MKHRFTAAELAALEADYAEHEKRVLADFLLWYLANNPLPANWRDVDLDVLFRAYQTHRAKEVADKQRLTAAFPAASGKVTTCDRCGNLFPASVLDNGMCPRCCDEP